MVVESKERVAEVERVKREPAREWAVIALGIVPEEEGANDELEIASEEPVAIVMMEI